MIQDIKPYPAYKESGVPWLGDVPEHWEKGPGFAAFRQKKVKNVGLKEQTVLSLSYGRIVIKPQDKLHGLVPESFETYQIVDPGDIIIRSTDLQNDWTSLRVGLVRDRGIITSAYLCFKTTDKLLPEYGYQMLHAFDLMKIFYGMGSGLRQNLDFSDFKRMVTFIPPKDEQTAIVRFLDHTDRRIRRFIYAKQKMIRLLNEQKQAIIHQAVTRGLDPGVPMKASGMEWIGNVPDHWEVRRVKQLAKILRGKFTHRPRNDPDFYDGPYPFIQTGEVARAAKVITAYKQTLNEKGLAVSKMFPRGTLVMTIAANIGDVAVLDFEACFPDSVVGFVPGKAIDRDYLYYVFTCMKSELLREAPVNTQGNLNIDRVGARTIPVPPLTEQANIVRFIEEGTIEIDNTIAVMLKEAELIREYRIRLITDVVTGKLDVRGVAVEAVEEELEELLDADIEEIDDEMGDDEAAEE